MKNVHDLSGKIFNRFTVLNEYKIENKRTKWLCLCKCGNKKFVEAYNLKKGYTKSCGCLNKEQTAKRNTSHGMSKTKEYKVWKGIKKRCLNKNSNIYKYYGGRGIKICKRWENSFENFYKDMGPIPSLKHSIDRKDVNKGYCPKNCKWVIFHQQSTNKRTNNKITGIKKRGKKFSASIEKDKKCYHLGMFNTEESAAKAYDDKCEEWHGYRPNKTKK